jgi:nitrate reductase gamma subunit
MSGIAWHIFVFGAIAIFLAVAIYRTIAIVRLPIHLRWELAPIPHEKGKGKYGGSYLEEFEWWQKKPSKSRIAPYMYIAVEILLLRGVWKHNPVLWPLSFAFHMGIYLVFLMVIFGIVTAILVIISVPLAVLDVFLGITSALAIIGFILGSLGAIGLLLKRALDSSLRPFNTISKYFNPAFLGAVFVSGAYAWLNTGGFAPEMSLFIKGLVTLDSGVTVSLPLSIHIILALAFLIYLPFTDMIHFIAKYFTYHAVRWDDQPKNEKMKGKLRRLLSQPVSWSAAHVEADSKKSWVELTTKKTKDEKEA